MKLLRCIFLALMPGTALACGAPVCLVDPDSLALTRVITFDDIRSSYGPGWLVDEVLVLPGAKFGEHFAGQLVGSDGAHDRVDGQAIAPLTLMAGAPGQNLSVVFFSGNSVLNGYGAAGYPRRDAQGEGAIAVMFDRDQSALSFDLRGGESGAAAVLFLRRNGSVIWRVPVEPTGEFTVGFERTDGISDIAGFVVTNSDPQGMAIDTLRFGKPPDLS